jgi:type III pantothenate kinase
VLLVIDIGNTRTKWALADAAGRLQETDVCLNQEIAEANFPVKQATQVLIANVAGQTMAEQVTQMLSSLPVHFVTAKSNACGVKNLYAANLGIDRWAALVAAWQHTKHATVVVNAGTAITIDALSKGVFLGGTIMPGLHLLRASLSQNAALLNSQLDVGEGAYAEFPINTPDAIQTGCLSAVVGAIHLMQKRLEKRSGWLPKLVMTGGDARLIAQALNAQAANTGTKQVIIIENLVLQGLVLLGKDIPESGA